MQICRELGGYSYGQADLVRRAMSKKKADVMEKERVNFIAGCQKNGISREIANSIFDEMSGFAAYAFNKSHAAAYAIVAYQTAFLKRHHPREYMAALLTSVLDSTDKVPAYIEECNRMGISVLPPDINESQEGFTVSGNQIRFGLLAVKNLGAAVIRQVIEERERGGPYVSFVDFYKRLYSTELNKRSIESLVKSGAMDNLGAGRRQMLTAFPKIGELLAQEDRWRSTGQMSLFGEETAVEDDFSMPEVEEYDRTELLAMEKEVTGLYMSGHPMNRYDDLYEKYHVTKLNLLTDPDLNRGYDNVSVEILGMITGKRLKMTKSNQNMAFLTAEDMTSSIDVLVFARNYADLAGKLRVGEPLFLRGRVSLKEDEAARLILESALTIEERTVESASATGARNTAPRRSSANPGLYLRVPSLDAPEMGPVKLLFSIFDGGFPVYFRVMDTGKLLRAPQTMWVDPNAVLIRELERRLGVENVKKLE